MCDYEEMYYNSVPDEVTLKIHEIIKEEVNACLKSDLNELDRLRKLDKEKQDKIYELQREVKKIQQEYDQKLKTVLLEKQKEVQRKIFKGFTMRDKVFFIDHKYEYISCSTCQSTGKLKVIINEKEEEIRCPHCGGDGKNSKWIAYIRQGEIIQVDFKTWYDESEKCTESKFYIQPNDKNRDSTKVDVDDIFWTEEEVIKACELRNNKN
jgi:DNA-directed RNA polymerase subunit RPC12/RpoP